MFSPFLLSPTQEILEQNNTLKSNLLLNNNDNIFQDDQNDENFCSFFVKDEIFDDNSLFKKEVVPFDKINYLNIKNNDNLFSIIDNQDSENYQKGVDSHEKFNSVNNINDNVSYLNLNQLSMLTTSNSNIINNLGVKNEDLNINMNSQSEKINDNTFKCDFLENISLGLDEKDDNYYFNDKKTINLNNPTSLLAAIINLMKEKGPIDIKTITSTLENRKDTFRKANGGKYKQDFKKLVRITLNTPDIFYKTEEGNKYYFIEDKNAYYLKKKRERGMERIFMNLKKKNSLIPINIKIQLDKVNSIIKKMEKKYKGDKKYTNVMICVNLFKNLIKKYLFLVKMDKNNSLYELSVLNGKIIDICHTLEKIEKGELFFKINENIINKKANEYNNENNKNIMFVDGDNNTFNEPPNI